MSETVIGLLYLATAVLFIFSMRGLSSPDSARQGNFLGMLGMTLAVATTLLIPGMQHQGLIIAGIAIGGVIGTWMALRAKMTGLPQMVAIFNSLVGLAAVFIAAAAFYAPATYGIGTIDGVIETGSRFELVLDILIGAVTFTGSVIAFAKLQGLLPAKAIILPARHIVNIALGVACLVFAGLFIADQAASSFWTLALCAFILGVTIVIPIGGADMPVVISLLNTYSGWSSVAVGFTLDNPMMIIAGALVGASGAILSYIMCKGMNRSLLNVMAGGFGAEAAAAASSSNEGKTVKRGSADDAAFIMKNSSSVIIVPGYGMAVSQAQHVLREMVDHLKKAGVTVRYAIHPVAGRMPGHMNVLLAEANVPYEDVFELEAINRDFGQADVAFVIGANDVTNPSAKSDPNSPIFGMPILEVENAKTVLFVKRSMAPGYAGVDNDLFFRDNTMMLFNDAKKMCEEIVASLAA